MDEFPELDPVVLDLLVVWDERLTSGHPITPEELCRACPERVDELRQHIERLGCLDPVIELLNPDATAPPVIRGYELLDELGRGGMGVVYRARDLSLNRVVAVKVPFGSVGADIPRARFEREAQTLAKLRHPNIVPVHAAGLVGDTPYFVMEYVSGGSLAEQIRNTDEWPPGRVAELMAQVALAVDHSHAALIIHRDLKPLNILVDETGWPFVTDFGVAAILAGESLTVPAGDTPDNCGHGLTCLTRTGAGVGTEAYTAPELQPGRSGTPSPTSDIWSLGVVLYECLTGRLPFPDPRATMVAPLPPRSIRPKIPRRLEGITLRCLATDPARRYSTASALARDLQSYLGSRGRWARRTGLIATILVGILGGLISDFSRRTDFQPQPDRTLPSAPPPHDPVAEQALVAERLVAGGEYKYEGTELHTGPFRPLIGGRGVPQHHPGGEGLSVTATSIELVEMLPDIPCSCYELIAEVRVDDAGPVGESRAGLYICFRAGTPTENDDPWAAITTSFAELGSDAGDRPPPNQSSGVRILGWLGKDRAAREKTSVSLGPGPRYKSSFALREPGPWRQIGVRVSPKGITVLWQEGGEWIPSPFLPAAQCSKAITTASGYLPPWAAPLPGFHSRGGVGLYTHNCRATFRRVVVRPLPGT